MYMWRASQRRKFPSNRAFLQRQPAKQNRPTSRDAQQPISLQQAVSTSIKAAALPEIEHSMRDVPIARVRRLVVKPNISPVAIYEPQQAPLQVTGA